MKRTACSTPALPRKCWPLPPPLPPRHQTLLFSATLPPAMAELAARLLHRPTRVSMAVEDAPAPRIAQYAIFVPMRHKTQATLACLRQYGTQRVMVFVRTRQEADGVARAISALVPAIAIHGDHSQARRERMLRDFRQGRVGVLVATDVMARGIDIDDVALVINHDIPPARILCAPHWPHRARGAQGCRGAVRAGGTSGAARDRAPDGTAHPHCQPAGIDAAGTRSWICHAPSPRVALPSGEGWLNCIA
ncbi:DEAD/DEAH box helicase [Komagataeibacter rhaeticus]|nr:DEAD/DEAH box helicase [Komagataeibacter rhaeticus]